MRAWSSFELAGAPREAAADDDGAPVDRAFCCQRVDDAPPRREAEGPRCGELSEAIGSLAPWRRCACEFAEGGR